MSSESNFDLDATTLVFNTGRLYTVHGQRIAAVKIPDGRVAFIDVDRGIDGVTLGPVELDQRSVMHAYDNGAYSALYLYTTTLHFIEEHAFRLALTKAAYSAKSLSYTEEQS